MDSIPLGLLIANKADKGALPEVAGAMMVVNCTRARAMDEARQAAIDARQRHLAEVVDEHDDLVRELFHLDRFVTLIGYDPIQAKQDRSDVFTTFQQRFDLYSNTLDGATGKRTTRRGMAERKGESSSSAAAQHVKDDDESSPAPPAARTSASAKSLTPAPAPSTTAASTTTTAAAATAGASSTAAKGKGKAKAHQLENGGASTSSSNGNGSATASGTSARGRADSRANLKRSALGASTAGFVSPRTVILNANGEPFVPPAAVAAAAQPAANNKRVKLSHDASSTATMAMYSHPSQVPVLPRSRAAHGGSLESFLSSWIVGTVADDDVVVGSGSALGAAGAASTSTGGAGALASGSGTGASGGTTSTERHQQQQNTAVAIPPSSAGPAAQAAVLNNAAVHGLTLVGTRHVAPGVLSDALARRAAHDASVFERVRQLASQGRTLANPDRKPAQEARRKKDHADHVVEHACYFAKLVADERKSHAQQARKLARMVTAHFDRLRGLDDRAQKEQERQLKALARGTAREVRKKWKMATSVVRARRREQARAEREKWGKEQLSQMLDASAGLLKAQQEAKDAYDDEDDDITDSAQSDDDDEEDGSDEGEEEGDDDDDGDDEQEEDEDQAETAADTPDAASVAGDDVSLVAATVDEAAESDKADDENDEEEDEDGAPGDFVTDEQAALREAEEDARMDAEMDSSSDDGDEAAGAAQAQGGGGGEMAGLAADAELPIEEILRREGYFDMIAAEQEGEPARESSSSTRQSTTSIASTPAPAPGENGAAHDDDADDDAEAHEGDFDDDAAQAARFAEEDAAFSDALDDDEAQESADSDAEMRGLHEDAELSVEELRRKYAGYDEVESMQVVEDSRELDDDKPKTNGVNGVGEHDEHEGDGEGHDEEEQEQEDEVDVEATLPSNAPHLRTPFLLRGTLRPYQQAGFEWLASLYTNNVNGILADEMGLGKTIQTISLLAHLACDRGQWGPHLVVVPTSVMLNWEMEFKKFLPGFKILTYHGNLKERKEKRRGWNTENAFHVCVTSYQLVLADQNIFRRKAWHYLILDEAHHIKNFRSQRWQTLLGFNARHRLLLTGTPLQNNLMELWSLLYFLMPPGLLQEKGPFAGHADFQAWFSNPMEKAIEMEATMDEETKATINKLHHLLRPYLLRRLKAEVETQMPGKTESVIYCRMSKRQRYLYDDFMSRSQTRDTLASGNFMSIINCLMQLRKVCNHPDLFEVRPIVTSFAMQRSVASDYEIKELLVRKRLLAEEPVAKIDWESLTLVNMGEPSTSKFAADSLVTRDASDLLPSLYEAQDVIDPDSPPPRDLHTIAGWRQYQRWANESDRMQRWRRMAAVNKRRCQVGLPLLGSELITKLREPVRFNALNPTEPPRDTLFTALPSLVTSYDDKAAGLNEIISRFAFVTPKVRAIDVANHVFAGIVQEQLDDLEEWHSAELLQFPAVKLSIAFPDRSLLQYDCGKLQKLDEVLRECKAGGHRALIFTQMTKVLDILEEFLSFHGHRYLRLDGSTKIEQRQMLTERFNTDPKILCFISSTRSGGLGINLQGADTVIFYDSDWNPALDRQCQDRAHRIGQTREVRIWRFVTEHSIEENMLRKANQKRRLDDLVISEGEFNTEYQGKMDWRDYLDEQQLAELGVDEGAEQDGGEVSKALAAAEDQEDADAAKNAEGELQLDQVDFNEAERLPASEKPADGAAPMEVEEEVDPLAGTVDGYMVRFVDENWAHFDA